MKKKQLIPLLCLFIVTNLKSQTPYVLNIPATNQAGVNSTVTGSCAAGSTVTIRRIDLSGNPLNFRTVGNTATLQLPLVINTDNSTNWTVGGTSPVYATVPTYIRFDSRDNFAFPAVTPTFLPAANPYRLEFTFSPATTNPVINFSGTANREIVALVPATVITPVLALDGSTGGRFSPGGALLPSPVATLITNGVRFTGTHGSDRYNVGIQLTGAITTAIIELTELADVGTWVNAGGASIWSQIDNMGVAVSGPCTTLPIKLESFTGSIIENKAALNWKTQTEYNVLHHQVEVSTNGVNFQTVGTVVALNVFGSTYTFDYFLGNETNYYFRLKTVERDGSYTYSNIVRLKTKSDNNFAIILTPNPAKDKVTISLPFAEKVTVDIIDSDGQNVKSLTVANNTNIISTNTLSSGVYFVRVTNNTGNSVIKKLIIE